MSRDPLKFQRTIIPVEDWRQTRREFKLARVLKSDWYTYMLIADLPDPPTLQSASATIGLYADYMSLSDFALKDEGIQVEKKFTKSMLKCATDAMSGAMTIEKWVKQPLTSSEDGANVEMCS